MFSILTWCLTFSFLHLYVFTQLHCHLSVVSREQRRGGRFSLRREIFLPHLLSKFKIKGVRCIDLLVLCSLSQLLIILLHVYIYIYIFVCVVALKITLFFFSSTRIVWLANIIVWLSFLCYGFHFRYSKFDKPYNHNYTVNEWWHWPQQPSLNFGIF